MPAGDAMPKAKQGTGFAHARPFEHAPWGDVGAGGLPGCLAQRIGPDDLGKQQGRRQKKATR